MTMPAPSRRLLLVDDDQDFAIATSRALALEGVDCLLAGDGAAARAALATNSIDVVLLDVRLGEEDGTELALQLKQSQPDLILVIMTAYASVDSAVAALQAGAYDYLRKPFFLDELMQVLTRCFELAQIRQDKLRIEQELALHRKLEAVSQLATGLSHDFKNMLAVIRANLAVINDRLQQDDRLKPYASDALEATATATDLVAQLMDFARSGLRRDTRTDLGQTIAASVAMLSRSLCRDMQLTLHLPEQALISPIDSGQLESAIANLLINARDATSGRGTVWIRLQSFWQGGLYARLTVEDDGPGLSPEELGHALEPRFTTKPDGMGLGLPMIRQLALVYSGSFRIENAASGGARAVLDLPCRCEVQGQEENM